MCLVIIVLIVIVVPKTGTVTVNQKTQMLREVVSCPHSHSSEVTEPISSQIFLKAQFFQLHEFLPLGRQES